MNITEALLTALKERGAGEIFGIPGDFALPYFKVIEESAILPLHTLCHEPGVGFAADAAARFRRGLGVCAVTYGAGALNLVNAVAQAYAEKSPVVVISGAPGALESRRGLLLHHQVKDFDSQRRIYEEITCDQAVLNDAGTAPAEIARVLRSALERSQPVYIEIPRDMAAAPCEPVPTLAPTPADPDAVEAAAEAVLARLDAAARPVLMVGVEVRRYGLEDKVERLAGLLGVPVVTSFMGRGLLACSAQLVGTYLGAAGEEAVTRMVEESDGLCLLGVIVSDTNFGVSAQHIDMRRTVQACDREVRLGFHVYPNIPLGELVDALLARAAKRGQAPAPAPCKAPELPCRLPEDDAPITPRDIAAAVNDLFDAKGAYPMAVDIGDCLFTAMQIRQTPLVAPGYYASMGFGVPAGLGVQAATGQRPLILVGDGAFQMTGNELGNCARLGLDPIVLVFDNAAWEMLRVFQPGSKHHDISRWDYAAYAEALGGTGHRVTTRAELKKALFAAAGNTGRFQLIDIILAPGALSDTLARFVAGVRRVSGVKA